MERSTVIGRSQGLGVRGQGLVARRILLTPGPRHLSPGLSPAFTLLELMIVITIIIILAAIALPQYQKTVAHAREAVLRDDLFKIRTLIDQYAADKGKLPQSLDDLVSSGYMREVPLDPFTDNRDWTPTMGDDPNSSTGEQGLTDIHSSSPETGSDGKPYTEW